MLKYLASKIFDKMLYIFHVDTGTMMTFDMSLALESVAELKKYVETGCGIPVDKQVLLVSGGESLDERARVCSYSAGTDTNPIFLFSKSVIESTTPPSASMDYGSDSDLKAKVKDAQNLPATYDTVVQRAQLAQQFHECAKHQTKICEKLVHDQHLQQQGWAAVIANLEDLTVEFRKRSDMFEDTFNDYLSQHDNYLKFLKFFHQDLQILAKIPIIPSLLDSETGDNADSAREEGEKEKKEEEATNSENDAVTLLQWISDTDCRSTMDQLYEHCSKGLEQFDERIFKTLHSEIENAIETSNKSNMKEVKGLGDRLFGLEQLMLKARQYVREQADLAQSFLQNQNRAGNLGDTSILPDLCESHRNQLNVMLENHSLLCDIRRRCTKAKEELSVNLYHRLRWVMYVENLMLDANHKLVIYHDNLKRLRQHLEVLQQIHMAPAMYLSAVAEVVRRRRFSEAFLMWASELACHLLTIHNEEVTRRKEFQAIFDGHFLNDLFPGMNDLPPSFATQAPSIFDSSLPLISLEDIEKLKQALPDLTENLIIPDMSAITNFFLAKSIVKADIDQNDDRGIEEKLVQVVNAVGLASTLDQNLLKASENDGCLAVQGLTHLKDLDKGCESETDTEEFEKVCQSPMDLQFDKDLTSRPGSQEVPVSKEVGEKSPLPPKKPPRSFQKLTTSKEILLQPQRTLSISGSNTESFTNIKNTSLESIDELSSLKNTDSCYNSHHQHLQSLNSPHFVRSKSLSPQSPPKCEHALSPVSPSQGHQPSDFVNEEYYIDESLPSSLSIETGNTTNGEYAKQLSNANDVVALLQDNLQTSRTEQTKLTFILQKLSHLSYEAMFGIRKDLVDLIEFYLSEKKVLESNYASIANAWTELCAEQVNREKELVRRITLEHESELTEYKRRFETHNDEIKCLNTENLYLEKSLKKVTMENDRLRNELSDIEDKKKEIDELNEKISQLESDNERKLRELSDKLTREHKAEIESVRTRFRLMAGADRTPSDPNLDKIDKTDWETIVSQIKENCEVEKLKAIEEARQEEAHKWQKILQENLEELTNKFSIEKASIIEEVSMKVSEEKDKLIDILRDREANLNLDCIKYRNTIHQLTECEFDCNNEILKEKVQALEMEKDSLEQQLIMEKSRRLEAHEMIASVSVVQGTKNDAATSPVRHREKLTKSQTSLIKFAKLSIDSCSVGDAVLIIWNSDHENYTILQEGSNLYFLNTDSLEDMGLKKPAPGESGVFYCTGEVLDKEYCHAKRSENRYKVPKGTKFYRVRVKPLTLMKEANRSTHQMSQSQSQTAAPHLESSAADSACHSAPNSPTLSHCLQTVKDNKETEDMR